QNSTTQETTHDFGTVTPGNQIDLTFTVHNDSGATTGKLGTKLTGSNAYHVTADGCQNTTLRGGSGTCNITVRFFPQVLGAATATLAVTDSTGANIMASDTFTGTGTAPSALTVSAPTAFTAFVGETQSQTITVTNSGGGATGLIVIG